MLLISLLQILLLMKKKKKRDKNSSTSGFSYNFFGIKCNCMNLKKILPPVLSITSLEFDN